MPGIRTSLSTTSGIQLIESGQRARRALAVRTSRSCRASDSAVEVADCFVVVDDENALLGH